MATGQSESLNKYEGVVILHPDCTDIEQKNILKKNGNTISSFEGRVNHLDTWGRRRLANPIGKNTMGVYFHTTFEAKGGVIAELERTMKINDRVLRFMHLRLDDRVNMTKYLEQFKDALQETAQREKEREAKIQQRKAAGTQKRERF